MKFILVSSSANLGGGERNLLDIAEYLSAKKDDVQVIIPGPGRMVEVLGDKGIPFLKIDMPSYPGLRAVLHMRRRFKQDRPALVHAHGTKAALFARLASAGLKIPIVYTLHGIHYLNYSNPFKRWIYIFVERLLMPLTKRFVCVCQRNLEEGKQAKVIDADKTVLIYNGIDSRPSDLRERARKERGLNDEVIVLNIGRLQDVKGQIYLIKAASRLKKFKDKVKVWVVGEGEEENKLCQVMAEERVEGIVSLLGYQEDIWQLLAAADVFVLPSLGEGFPYAVLEAMAFRKPVVASNVGGIPEMIVEGETGSIVPPADAEALAEKIVYLIENPAVRKAWGEAGARRVAKKFNLKKMLRQYQQLYDDLLLDDRELER